jgi:polyhydroxyalkanoate synthesis regulator protein
VGRNILMIVICEVENKQQQPVLNIGLIEQMVGDYRQMLQRVD